MAKLLLLSVIFATIALPVRAARDKNPKRGLERALGQIALVNVFYLCNLYYLQSRL